jgi:hypothetical protein
MFDSTLEAIYFDSLGMLVEQLLEEFVEVLQGLEFQVDKVNIPKNITPMLWILIHQFFIIQLVNLYSN